MKIISPIIEVLTNKKEVEEKVKFLREHYLQSYDRKLKPEDNNKIKDDIYKQVYISVYLVHNRHTTDKLTNMYGNIIDILQKPVKYSLQIRDMEFIKPYWYKEPEVVTSQIDYRKRQTILEDCQNVETKYNILLSLGLSFDDASDVLSNYIKTELYCTTSIRSWIDILSDLNKLSSENDKDLYSMFNRLLAKLVIELPGYFDNIPQGYAV